MCNQQTFSEQGKRHPFLLSTLSATLPSCLLLKAETCVIVVNVLTDFIINLAVVNFLQTKIYHVACSQMTFTVCDPEKEINPIRYIK